MGERWWGLLVGGELDWVVFWVCACVVHGSFASVDARNLVDYRRLNEPGVYAAAELRARGAPKDLCMRGSGAIEHNVDLMVARRMKEKGMFWSREGAENMLALRCAALDPKRWREAVAA